MTGIELVGAKGGGGTEKVQVCHKRGQRDDTFHEWKNGRNKKQVIITQYQEGEKGYKYKSLVWVNIITSTFLYNERENQVPTISLLTNIY